MVELAKWLTADRIHEKSSWSVSEGLHKSKGQRGSGICLISELVIKYATSCPTPPGFQPIRTVGGFPGAGHVPARKQHVASPTWHSGYTAQRFFAFLASYGIIIAVCDEMNGGA